MDSAFSSLGFVIFGISISFYAFIVQSLTQNGNNGAELAPPAYWVSSPPSPPTPPLLSPYPPPPPSQSKTLRPGALPPHPNNRPNVRRPPPPHRRHHHRRPPPPPPPPPPHKMNAGKKVGLLFVGIAAIMQVGVVGFLNLGGRNMKKKASMERHGGFEESLEHELCNLMPSFRPPWRYCVYWYC
ncbi:hypothetical protein JHK87_037010 [Glycine soja]|nr:hypothetical protein JHK87_037010 [Glycine soja]